MQNSPSSDSLLKKIHADVIFHFFFQKKIIHFPLFQINVIRALIHTHKESSYKETFMKFEAVYFKMLEEFNVFL